MSELKVGDLVTIKPFGSTTNPFGCKILKVTERRGDFSVLEAVEGSLKSALIPNQDLSQLDPQQMYRDAVFAVDPGACNLSGLAHSLSRHMDLVWHEARAASQGTDFVNRHPVVVLVVSQMAYLCGCENTERYCEALAACREKAGLEKEEANV